MAAKPKPVASKPSQPIPKADSLVLSLTAEKDGKIRTNARSLDNPAVVQPGGRLEVIWEGGQVLVLIHAPKRK